MKALSSTFVAISVVRQPAGGLSSVAASAGAGGVEEPWPGGGALVRPASLARLSAIAGGSLEKSGGGRLLTWAGGACRWSLRAALPGSGGGPGRWSGTAFGGSGGGPVFGGGGSWSAVAVAAGSCVPLARNGAADAGCGEVPGRRGGGGIVLRGTAAALAAPVGKGG